MVQRVPDEYFRNRAAESEDVRADDPSTPVRERPRPARADRPSRPQRAPESARRRGIAPNLLIVPLVLALIAGFIIGRLLPQRTAAEPDPLTTSASVAPAPPQAEAIVPFDGAAAVVSARYARGACGDGTGDPAALLDNDPRTVWRCAGDGVGEVADFVFERPVELVGIRLVNGNLVDDRFLEERRITAIRWTFSDGSFFDQGFAPSESSPQEVRFPQTVTSFAHLEILATTPGAGEGEDADAMTISSVEFLAPA